MEPFTFKTTAQESLKDYRTIKHTTTKAGLPSFTGGIHYKPSDLDNQRKEGECTSVSLTQNAGKYKGKKYNKDFQYLVQKKYIDGNWDEGSSPLSSLKAGFKFGFLPDELWTFTTNADHNLPYDQFIAKLQAIPDAEIQRLMGLTEKILTGYTQVDVSTAENIAQAILDSSVGILCRYSTGTEWYTDANGAYSWEPAKIDPISPNGRPRTGGHQIGASFFDYRVGKIIEHPNTWGGPVTPDWPVAWDMDGICTINWDDYKMTEAWVPHYEVVFPRIILPAEKDFHPVFLPCKKGDRNQAVKDLQTKLMIMGFLELLVPADWGIYGPKTQKAVYNFQLKYVKMSVWESMVLRGSVVGPKTLVALSNN